jgi:hypothetical protein
LSNLEPDKVLSAGISAGCIGYATNALLWGSKFNTWMFLETSASERFAVTFDYIVAFMLLACAVMVWLQRFQVSGILLTGWVGLNVFAAASLHSWRPELVILSAAARAVAPIGLLLWVAGKRRESEWALRVGIALTFAAHGVEAFLFKREFVDFVLESWRIVGVDLANSQAHGQLHAIALLDVTVAALILIPRKMQKTALWMAMWGGATALLRVVYSGFTNTPEFLVRLSHSTVPLALFLIWRGSPDEFKD